MVLDSSFYTLVLERRNNEPNILDLIPFSTFPSQDEKPTPLYTFSRAKIGHYSIRLIDHLTGITLSSIDCPASIDKLKSIQLYNPDAEIVLEKKGMTFKQDWRWVWEENDFSIRKEGKMFIIEAIRKPDPEIDIARYTPKSRSRPATLQILDYNIQRLDIKDKRGLEMLIIATTCHLLDQEFDELNKDHSNGIHKLENIKKDQPNPLITPPIPKTRGAAETNEILLDFHVADSSYTEHALNLLRQDEGGDGLQMIIIRADSAILSQRAVRIAAEIKARWYKLPAMSKGRTLDPMPGNRSEIAEELYQYVRDPDLIEKQESGKKPFLDPSAGPRGRIKLDSPSPPINTPPSNANKKNRISAHQSTILTVPTRLDIYLSKDRIDEFERSLSTSSSTFSVGQQHERPTTPAAAQPPPPTVPPKTATGNRLLGRLGLRKFDT